MICIPRKLNLPQCRMFFILLISSVFTLSLKSQDTLTYKYFVGTADPDTNWKTLSFNDGGWSSGYGPIGYGDHDDSTLIGTTSTLFIRYTLRFADDYKKYKGLIIY